MGRAPCCDKVGLNRGRWTAEEDDILTKYIQANGEGSWRSLPKNAGLLRCGKSCRLRWVNYLKSDLKRGKFSYDEDETIIKLHSSLGNRWCLIASHLPGRTDNEIKNYWNSHLSRQIYKFRKIIQQLNQEPLAVDQPIKSAGTSTDVAPKPLVSRSHKSISKKKEKVHVAPPEKALDKSIESTTSREVENGGSIELMPATPALEEDVMSSMINLEIYEDKEPMDDIFLSSFLDDIVSDHGFEVDPIADTNLQTLNQQLHGDPDGELLLSNDEVEKWLMDDNDTLLSRGDDPSLKAEVEKFDQVYNCSSTNLYLNDELDVPVWDCGNMDWDSGVQDPNLWDSEDEKLFPGLWEGTSDKGDDGDHMQNALVEWLLS